MRTALLLTLPAFAALAVAADVPKTPEVKFTESRLDNGLRVIVAEDHDAPTFSICVTYNVGSRDERKGRTGFAHLFEHMMFKGSEKVGPGEHFYLVFTNGGNMNGTTNQDRTTYFETLPKNQLDLGLFLEADRMRSLAVTKENLDNQRNAVQEERRLGIDNRPYGLTYEKISELAYDNFAYKHSVIGSMEDLNAASVEDVRDFFKTYYAPNNAVLAIVGDVKTADVVARAKKYFGDIPRQEPAKPVDLSEPPPSGERRLEIKDKLARLTQLVIVYKIPESGHPDTDAMGVLGMILGGGESSRLYQRLVKEKELATSVFAYGAGRKGPGLFQITAMVRPGKKPEEVEA
ncbi:MAG TPA: pitrilysin family protein, partial [Bryobacteraceae bacterium]|nr:pitrilysin family protein [Bryobacteraceae bacterium]